MKKVSRRFEEKVARAMVQKGRPSRNSLIRTLETLVRWLRGARSAIERLNLQAEYLQEHIIDLMNRLDMREHSFARTAVQRIVRLQIQTKEDYEKVKKILGKRAQDWIRVERVRIPARIETRYSLTKEAQEEIKRNVRLEEKIKKALNAPEYVVILKKKR